MKKPAKDAPRAELQAYARWVRKQLDATAPSYPTKEERRSAHLHDRYYQIEQERGRFAADSWITGVAERAHEKKAQHDD